LFSIRLLRVRSWSERRRGGVRFSDAATFPCFPCFQARHQLVTKSVTNHVKRHQSWVIWDGTTAGIRWKLPTYDVFSACMACKRSGVQVPYPPLNYKCNYYKQELDNADVEWLKEHQWRKRPSIHMPSWAARLTLEITDVRVQRLQDISEEDAIAEGCKGGAGPVYDFACHAFQQLLESLHALESWNSSPWVWALSFRAHQQNIDALLEQRKAA
jgi:hypothetical protein